MVPSVAVTGNRSPTSTSVGVVGPCFKTGVSAASLSEELADEELSDTDFSEFELAELSDSELSAAELSADSDGVVLSEVGARAAMRAAAPATVGWMTLGSGSPIPHSARTNWTVTVQTTSVTRSLMSASRTNVDRAVLAVFVTMLFIVPWTRNPTAETLLMVVVPPAPGTGKEFEEDPTRKLPPEGATALVETTFPQWSVVQLTEA
ncbi:hypothetical protein [Gordonia sp. C13]|uniref:hypothetical protein n=1 Tax=Gordonia sp. C13 TaxID=2935078 RepID=UPI00200B115C|nr:hypothetical protein [Gordonia sp. C13]MCK8614995.1 hypothetical protein [Gordonia sp. C13]